MTSDIAWEWYRSFLEVARTGSLSAAARSLGITQPTVGRHIAALEDRLAQRLFVRTASGLQPTEQALALRPYAESMAHTAAALERVAQGHGEHVQGTVRISATEMLAAQVLPTILAGLTAQHPGLQLEIVASDQLGDVLHREVDIAVRMLRPTQTQLIALHLGEVELGLYAHARYLAQCGTPMSLADVRPPVHRLVGFDQSGPFVRQLMQQWPSLQRSDFSYRTDSASTAWALLQAGAGLGLCHVALAQQVPQLQRVLQDEVRCALPMWLTMHEDLRAHAACQQVFQALAAGLRAYAVQAEQA